MKLKNWLFGVRTAFAVVIFAVLLMIFTFSAYAASDNSEYIASFDSSADGFTAYENTASAAKAEFYFDDGRSASCLEVSSYYVPIGSLRSVVKTFDTVMDFSGYRKLTYSIFVPEYSEDADAVYYARLILRSDDGREFESIDTAMGGQWTEIETDISTFDGRFSVSSMEIAFIVDTSLDVVISDSFYIDDVFVSDVADLEMIERFLFDSYTVEGGTALVSSDKSKISVFSSSVAGVTFSAPISMPNPQYDVNCLRLKLANYTDGDYLTLYYSVMDGRAVSESKSVIVPIEPNSEAKFYYVPINGVDQIKQISLLFGENIGRIELISLNTAYMTESESKDAGGKVSCRINNDLESISFSGEISRETALENQSGKIKIYKLDGDISDLSELDDMTPVAESSMTTKFDITWHIPSDLTLTMLERYVAVISADNGEYLLISPHVYVENPEVLAENSTQFPVDGKGFYTDDLTLVADADSDVTVLEFDMSAAFADKTDGVAYTYGGVEYYLNSEYVAELGRQIDMMASGGTSVIVRITNRTSDHVILPITADEVAVPQSDYIGAVSAYIAEKWVSDGRVCGVILGFCENRIDGRSDIGEMIAECAESLRKISVNLRKYSEDARLYLSVTDLFSRDILTNTDELPLTEYLELLLNSTSVYGANFFGLCVELLNRTENVKDATFISVSDNDELKTLTEKHDGLKYNLIFCDEIYKKQQKYLGMLLKDYVVGYHTAIFDDGVDCYIAVADGKSTGLASAVKVIDTTSSDTVITPALAMLEAKSLSDVIDKFDVNRLEQKLFTTGSVSYTVPEKILGQYQLYEFNSAASIASIDTNYYSSECRLINDAEKGTVLWVGINHEADDILPSAFGTVADFEYTENLEFMSWIGVEMKLCGDFDEDVEKVPVKLVLNADGERFESMAEVTPRQWTTVYFNTDDFKNSKNTKRMQILAGGAGLEVSELRIKEIVGLSGEYNDESLESVVLEERMKKRDPSRGIDYGPYMWLGGGLLVTVATCVTVALLSRKKRDGDKDA